MLRLAVRRRPPLMLRAARQRRFCQKEAFPGEFAARRNTKMALLITGGLSTATVYWTYKLYKRRVSVFSLLGDAPDRDNNQELPDVTHRVYLDVEVDEEPAGRLVLGLFGDLCPKTAENFRLLCTQGVRATVREGRAKVQKQVSYVGSPFHRILPGFLVQGGDIIRRDGKGGRCAFGRSKFFADENFEMKHIAGSLAMANAGPDTNNSQFYIMLRAEPALDGKAVVFGHLLEGVETLQEIELMGTTSGQPISSVVVVGCGELPLLAPVEASAEAVAPTPASAVMTVGDAHLDGQTVPAA